MKGSCGWRHFPSLRYWADIGDDLTMVGPSVLNSIVSANTGTSWVSWRTKPVVLWCSSSACSKSTILSTINCVAKNILWPLLVIWDDCSGEVIGDRLQHVKNRLQLCICVLSYNLELAKQFFAQNFSLTLCFEVLQWNEYCCWLPRSVLLRNVMAFKRSSTPKNFCSIKFKNCILMLLDLFVVPR